MCQGTEDKLSPTIQQIKYPVTNQLSLAVIPPFVNDDLLTVRQMR